MARRVKQMKKVFEVMVSLGLNPLYATYTVADNNTEAYAQYAKSRMRVIERGEDLVFKFVDVMQRKIVKKSEEKRV